MGDPILYSAFVRLLYFNCTHVCTKCKKKKKRISLPIFSRSNYWNRDIPTNPGLLWILAAKLERNRFEYVIRLIGVYNHRSLQHIQYWANISHTILALCIWGYFRFIQWIFSNFCGIESFPKLNHIGNRSFYLSRIFFKTTNIRWTICHVSNCFRGKFWYWKIISQVLCSMRTRWIYLTQKLVTLYIHLKHDFPETLSALTPDYIWTQ